MTEIHTTGALSLSSLYVKNLNENFIDLLTFTYGSEYVQIDATNPIRFTVLRQSNGTPPASQSLRMKMKELELLPAKMEALRKDNEELSKQIEWYKVQLEMRTPEGKHKYLFDDSPDGLKP